MIPPPRRKLAREGAAAAGVAQQHLATTARERQSADNSLDALQNEKQYTRRVNELRRGRHPLRRGCVRAKGESQ